MRAILLAAGLGTRLRPLTEKIPKCLVPIGDKPLLEIWLERLTSSGIGPMLVNTHYLHELVEKFVDKSRFKENITTVYEPFLLGTAGTLLSNIGFFGDQDGMLLHADNYCLADLKAFQNAHHNRPKECLMTMMTFRSVAPSSCGIVIVDDRGVVKELHEKTANPPGNLANGAIYILSSEMILEFKKMSSINITGDFVLDVLKKLMGRIYTYETNEYFLDVGSLESYRLANKYSQSLN